MNKQDRHTVDEHVNACFPPGCKLVAIPSWRRARLITTDETRLWRWRASRHLHARRMTTKLLRFILRTIFSVSPSPLISSRKNIDALSTDSSDIENILIMNRMIAIPGTPDERRKLLILLCDSNAKLHHVAKVGWLPEAREAIQHEALVLQSCHSPLMPKFIAAGTIGGGDALVMGAVSGKEMPAKLPKSPLSAEEKDWRHLDNLIAAIQKTKTTAEIGACPKIQPQEIEQLQDFAETVARDYAIQPVFEHGDFSPWNILREKSLTHVIDWEHATPRGLPHTDLIHYIIQLAALIHNWPVETTLNYALKRLAELLEEEDLARVHLVAALARIICRYNSSPPNISALQQYRLKMIKFLFENDSSSIMRTLRGCHCFTGMRNE